MAITTDNLKLVLPDEDEAYDVKITNSNFNKINEMFKTIGDIKLIDEKVQITDKNNKFTGTTLDKVLDEIDDKVSNISLVADKVSYKDTTTQIGATNVQQALEWAVREIKALKQEVTGQTTRLSNINTELETEIGNPV